MCSTFIGCEAALLLDGHERPFAIDDLAVEDVVADDEDGRVLRLVIVQVADELPAESHVADAGFKITLEGRKIHKTGMAEVRCCKAFQAAEVFKTNLHFNYGPLVFLALRAFDEKLHGFESKMIRLEYEIILKEMRLHQDQSLSLEVGAPASLPRAKPKQRLSMSGKFERALVRDSAAFIVVFLSPGFCQTLDIFMNVRKIHR